MKKRKNSQKVKADKHLGKFPESHVLHVGGFSLGFLNHYDDSGYSLDIPISYEFATIHDMVELHDENTKLDMQAKLRKRADEYLMQAKKFDAEAATYLRQLAFELEVQAGRCDDLYPTDDDDEEDLLGVPDLSFDLRSLAGTPDDPGAEFRRAVESEKNGIVNFTTSTHQGIESPDNNKRADFWRKLHELTELQKCYFQSGFPTVEGAPAPLSQEWNAALNELSKIHEPALKYITKTAKEAMGRLLEVGKMGNDKAIIAFVEVLAAMIRQLDLYAKINPKLFKKAGRKLTSWPVMYSPHRKLTFSSEQAVASVELGKECPFIFGSSARWDPKELGTKIAVHLFKYIEYVKRDPSGYEHFPYCDAIKKLPDLSVDGAANVWWMVAREILEFSMPDLISDPFLSQLSIISGTAPLCS